MSTHIIVIPAGPVCAGILPLWTMCGARRLQVTSAVTVHIKPCIGTVYIQRSIIAAWMLLEYSGSFWHFRWPIWRP